MAKVALVLYLIAILSVQTQATCNSQGDTTSYTSEATYYGVYTGGGACTLDPTPPAGSMTTVAIADNIWAGSAACGMCVNITSTDTGEGASPLKGSFLAFVNNECPSCSANGIDLGLSGDGLWGITWKTVPCPVAETKIQFLWQGSNTYYMKLQVRNTRYPIKSVSALQNGVEKALERTADNFWTAGSSFSFPIVTPLQVKVTATTGDVIVDFVPRLQNGVVLTGTAQFADCSAGASASASTTASSASTVATASTAATATKSTSTTTARASTSTTAATTKVSTVAAATTKVSTTAAAVTTTAKAAASTTTTTTTGVSITDTQTYVVVYDDFLNAPFQDWSWATVEALASTRVFAGLKSYGFYPRAYQAAYLSNPGGISTTTYSAIEFYVYSPYAIPTLGDISFGLVKGSGSVATQKSISSYTAGSAVIPANTWTKATVPLSAWPSDTYDGFWFQDMSGSTTNPEVYLDSIKLVKK